MAGNKHKADAELQREEPAKKAKGADGAPIVVSDDDDEGSKSHEYDLNLYGEDHVAMSYWEDRVRAVTRTVDTYLPPDLADIVYRYQWEPSPDDRWPGSPRGAAWESPSYSPTSPRYDPTDPADDTAEP